MAFNGPGRELDPSATDHLDESVYCVQCGTIYVPAGTKRRCPSCNLAERLEDIKEKAEQLDRDLDAVDVGGGY